MFGRNVLLPSSGSKTMTGKYLENVGSKLSFVNGFVAYSLTLHATNVSLLAPDCVSPHNNHSTQQYSSSSCLC
jgi:hypothetical protein